MNYLLSDISLENNQTYRCLDFEKEIDLINVAFDQSSDQGEIAEYASNMN